MERGILGMIILIDGYNILKQRDPGAYIHENIREQLIRVLGLYCKKRGHLILLIFDGGSCSWPVRETKSGIFIIYAGAGNSADDFIKQYIAEHHTDDLLLVSSDRELGAWASKYDIASMDSLPFYNIITDTRAYTAMQKKKPCAVVKTTEREDPSLDALMEEASAKVMTKEEDKWRAGEVLPRGKKESKRDRLLRKKIEKL